MKRRFALAALAVTTMTCLVGGWASAASASTLVAAPVASPASSPTNEHHDWWCVAVDTIDFGYCQGDPFPERLPV